MSCSVHNWSIFQHNLKIPAGVMGTKVEFCPHNTCGNLFFVIYCYYKKFIRKMQKNSLVTKLYLFLRFLSQSPSEERFYV